MHACLEPGLCCRRMFASAVVVGLYHKSDNTIDINPDETKVFAADDQIVALSTSGDSSCRAISAAVQRVCFMRLVGILYTVVWQVEPPPVTCSL